MLDAALLSPGQRHVPGIVGGVGPLAHVHFEQELLRCGYLRGARKDRDHPVWLVANAASTPDRGAALLDGEPSPVPNLIGFGRLLAKAGADVLFVICNTAHAFHAEVEPKVGIPWAHLMRMVAERIAATHRPGTAVGVLGTDGTLTAGLYHREIEAHGLVPVAPPVDSPVQRAVMAAIHDPATGIKATGAEVSRAAHDRLREAAAWCVDHGAQVIVAGCTELSVAFTIEGSAPVTVVDPVVVAAEAALDLSYGRREPASFRAPE